MTRTHNGQFLHRASERVTSAAAAVALTFFMLVAVDARADEPQGNPPSVTVRFSDLAMADTANAAKVYRKLRHAANKVCGVNFGARSLHEHIRQQECVEQALTNAVREIDRPTLTALHASRARTVG